MAHDLTGGFETVMSATVQKYLEKISVFRSLASFREEAVLAKGTTVNRPFRSGFVAEDYVANTDVTATDTATTASNLTVDVSKAVRINIDPVEDIQLQTNPDSLRALYGPRMAYILADLQDRDFFDEVDNAGLTLDESDFLSGSSAGDPIDLDTVNAEEVWNDAMATLGGNNIGAGGMYAVVDHKMMSKIAQRAIGTTFNLSDTNFLNGFTGAKFAGFNLFLSENLPSTQTFTLTAVTEDLTWVIAGVTWTFKDALGSTAGNVFTNSAVADTGGTNLAKAINGDTASTFYVEVGADERDRIRVKGLAASYATGTNIMTITGYGRFKTTISAAILSATGEQTVKAMCGMFGAIDMVVQMGVNMQLNKAVGNLGSALLGHSLWGTKTFEDGAQRLLKISVKN